MEPAKDVLENNIEILFESDDVCVINKPSGMSAHKDGTREEETVADWFVATYPHTKGVGEPLELNNGNVVDRPGVVHRLDKHTSGVMILAKKQEAFAHLKEQFQNRAVEKTYRLFVWGLFKEDEGVIDLPIGRSRGDFRKRSAEFGAKEPLRDAYTAYKVLKQGVEHSYIEAHPKTGRMHQLRVHFKAKGRPLVCDPLYAEKKPCGSDASLGLSRLALHAHTLTLLWPGDTEKKQFTAPVPHDFITAEDAL